MSNSIFQSFISKTEEVKKKGKLLHFFMLSFLLAVASHQGTCTQRNTIITLTSDDYMNVIGKDKPVFLRMANAGCPSAPASQESWKEASELHPDIVFAEIECLKYGTICKSFGGNVSPSHAIFEAGKTKQNETFGNLEIFTQSQGFTQKIQETIKLFPIDTAPFEQLFPSSTDSFYKNHDYPIFVLYDSTCTEDSDFLMKWVAASVKEIFPEEVNYGFGRLDCSQYPDECSRWGTEFPSAVVFSKKTGASASLKVSENIGKKVETVIAELDQATPVEAPAPVNPAEPDVDPEIEAEKITNKDLENRDLETIRAEYLEAMKFTDGVPYDGNYPNVEKCEDVTHKQTDIDEAIKRINFYRKLAGLPSTVTNKESLNEGCYLTAKTLTRANAKTHDLSDVQVGFCCSDYSALVKKVAQNSNFAHGSDRVSKSIHGFMLDNDDNNKGVIGHRRWLLYPYLTSVGIGFYPESSVTNGKEINLYESSSVVQVIDDEIPYNNADYTENAFTAWPAPGPFPLDELPNSWTIYYPELAKDDTTLDNIKVKITRDDGVSIGVSQLYLAKDTKGLPGQLIIELSKDGLEKCTTGHKFHVQAYILKTKNQVIDYNFYLFDEESQEEVCFYETNAASCPESIDDSKKFGSSSYLTYKPESTSIPRVIIHVAETLKPQSSLTFDFAQKILVVGGSIDGSVAIGANAVCDISYPELTDISIKYVLSKSGAQAGKLVTAKKAKSITIDVSGSTESNNFLRTAVYQGEINTILYSQNPFKAGDYANYFSFSYTGNVLSITCLPISRIAIYFIGDPYDDYIEGGVILENEVDLAKISTKKEFVRIYTKANGLLYMKHFPAEPHDYQIKADGLLSFYYNINYVDCINSISFYPKNKGAILSLRAEEDTISKTVGLVYLKSITIEGFSFQGSSPIIIPPALKGDDAAKAQYQNETKFKQLSDDVFGVNGFLLSKSNVGSETSTLMFSTTGKPDTLTLNNGNDQTLEYVVFVPEEGKENISLKVDMSSYIQSTPIFFNYDNVEYITDELYNFPYFYNVKNFKITTTASNPSFYQIKSFSVNGCEYNISSSTIPYKFDELNVQGDSKVKADSSSAGNLMITNGKSSITGITVTGTLMISDADVTFNNSNINGKTITLTRNGKCPSITFVGGTFNPSTITLDMNVQSTSSRKSLADATPETYTVFYGITEETAQSLLSKIKIKNGGNFKCFLSCDKTGIVVTNQEEVDCTPDSGDDDKPSSTETKPDDDKTSSTEAEPDDKPSNSENKPSSNDGSNPDEGNKQEDGDNTAAIVGGSIAAVVVVVAVVIVIVYFFVIRPRSENDVDKKAEEDEDEEAKAQMP